jgi:hypothetical protein
MSTAQEHVEHVLAHHGVKGMKWGVRREAKKVAKADKKWEKDLSGIKGFIRVNNSVAEKINPRLNVINSKPKYNVDMLDPKNKSVHKAYMGEYKNALQQSLDETMAEIGTNASGTKKVALHVVGEGMDINYDGSIVDVKHDGLEGNFTVKPKFNAKGQVTGQTIEASDPVLEQAEDFVENYLAHFGVKGMKWGVRKREKAPSSDDASSVATKRSAIKKNGTHVLSNKELQEVVTRMNLEQQYDRLAAGDISRGRKVLNALLGDLAKTSAKRVVKVQGQELGDAVNEQIKKAREN